MSEISSSKFHKRDELVVRVGGALRQMSQLLEDRREQAAKQQSLHPTDFACIGYLSRENRPVSPKEIGPQLGLSSGSITALLDRLEKVGFIRRVSNPEDRRSVLIELDRDVATEAIALYRRLENSYRNVAESFSEQQLETIASFLEKMTRLSLATAVPPAKP